MKILVLAANTSTVLLDPCRNVPFVSTFPMYVYVCPEPVLTNIPQNIPNIPGFTWKYKNRRRERHFRTVFAQQHVAIKLDGVTAKQLRHRPQDARMQHDVIYCAAPIGKIARERLRVALRDSEATSDLRRIPAENASVFLNISNLCLSEPVVAKRIATMALKKGVFHTHLGRCPSRQPWLRRRVLFSTCPTFKFCPETGGNMTLYCSPFCSHIISAEENSKHV